MKNTNLTHRKTLFQGMNSIYNHRYYNSHQHGSNINQKCTLSILSFLTKTNRTITPRILLSSQWHKKHHLKKFLVCLTQDNQSHSRKTRHYQGFKQYLIRENNEALQPVYTWQASINTNLNIRKVISITTTICKPFSNDTPFQPFKVLSIELIVLIKLQIQNFIFIKILVVFHIQWNS